MQLNFLSKNKYNLHSLILLTTGLLFYLFFAIYDGAVICVDSPSYINMEMSREPIYPVFLAVLRNLFSVDNTFYLTVAAFLQSILAAFAAFMLADFLRRDLKLPFIISYMILGLPLFTSLLCRFAAKRSSMYSNSILTEGIACSLFLIFIRFLLEYCYYQNRKSLIVSSFLSFILISTRKQMYLTLILLVICIIYVSVKTHRFKYGLLTLVICTFCILLCNKALDTGYVYTVHGSAGTHSNDNRFLATMVFYVSEKEDFQYIENNDLRRLSEQIYTTCNENGYLKHSAEKGWYNRVTHFGDYYDCIQIDTMWPAIEKYVSNNYEGDTVALEKQVDLFTNEIITSLLPHVWPEILASFADNFLSGLITTVAQRRPVLIIYTILIYLIYIILLVINLIKEGMTRISVLSILTLISIVTNVAIVSAVIFCQTRYTIYNMPLFYISLLLLFYNLISTKTLRKTNIS